MTTTYHLSFQDCRIILKLIFFARANFKAYWHSDSAQFVYSMYGGRESCWDKERSSGNGCNQSKYKGGIVASKFVKYVMVRHRTTLWQIELEIFWRNGVLLFSDQRNQQNERLLSEMFRLFRIRFAKFSRNAGEIEKLWSTSFDELVHFCFEKQRNVPKGGVSRNV